MGVFAHTNNRSAEEVCGCVCVSVCVYLPVLEEESTTRALCGPDSPQLPSRAPLAARASPAQAPFHVYIVRHACVNMNTWINTHTPVSAHGHTHTHARAHTHTCSAGGMW
jgi:hypothetical protein